MDLERAKLLINAHEKETHREWDFNSSFDYMNVGFLISLRESRYIIFLELPTDGETANLYCLSEL